MLFIINGRSYEIKREDILNATRDVHPKQFDGRNRYYVELHGLKYPIKQPIHELTGLSYTEDFTAQYARRILKKLGFMVKTLEIMKVEPVRSTAAGSTEMGDSCDYPQTG